MWILCKVTVRGDKDTLDTLDADSYRGCAGLEIFPYIGIYIAREVHVIYGLLSQKHIT